MDLHHSIKKALILLSPVDRLLGCLDACMPPVASLAARVRLTVLEAVMERCPQQLVQSLLSPSLTHVLSATTCFYLTSVVLATTRALNLFAFHPIFMSLGVLAFMTEGFLVYRNGALVSTFSDIMAGSAKSQARSLHMVLQVGKCQPRPTSRHEVTSKPASQAPMGQASQPAGQPAT